MLVSTSSPTQAGSFRGILQTTRPQPAEQAHSVGPPTLVWRPHLGTLELQSHPLASLEQRAALVSQRRPAPAASVAGRPPYFKAWFCFFKYYLGTRNSGWTDCPSVRPPWGKHSLLRGEGGRCDAHPAWLSWVCLSARLPTLTRPCESCLHI